MTIVARERRRCERSSSTTNPVFSTASRATFPFQSRIDLFLQAPRETHDDAMLEEAIERAIAYGRAGASGIFVPGLADTAMIARLHAQGTKPLNVIWN